MTKNKCNACKKELTEKDGKRLTCKECLTAERNTRLRYHIHCILDDIYNKLMNRDIEMVDFKKEKIRTKYDAGKRDNPSKNKRYSGI